MKSLIPFAFRLQFGKFSLLNFAVRRLMFQWLSEILFTLSSFAYAFIDHICRSTYMCQARLANDNAGNLISVAQFLVTRLIIHWCHQLDFDGL